MKPIAVALFSGGLDSILAVKVIAEQGIKVHGVTFMTPFFGPEKAEGAAHVIDLPLTVIDITDTHLKMLKAPRYGYGRNMNPCIDCHILMLRQAGQFMEHIGADFIITGEVMGQRPMSQGKQTLALIAKQSGYGDLIVRPLSARLLSETSPEREGWVAREKLLAIQGRGRKTQIELAARYDIHHYATPAGGCLLTDPAFSRRLRSLFSLNPHPERRELEFLKYGRHFHAPQGGRIIVGRNQGDNKALTALIDHRDEVCTLTRHPGPTVIVPGGGDEETRILAAALCVLYSGLPEAEVKYVTAHQCLTFTVPALDRTRAQELIIS